MVRKAHTDRIINAWKDADLATTTTEWEQAWARIDATERNASPEEIEATRDIVARGPWGHWKRKK